MKEASRHLDMNCLASLCSERAFSPPPVLSLGIWRAAAHCLPPRLLSQHCAVLWPDGLSLLPGWACHLGDTTSPPAQGLCVGQQPGNCRRFDNDSNAYHFFFLIFIASVTANSFRAGEEMVSMKLDKVLSLWLASFIWWKISHVMLVLLAVFLLTPVITQHELETISEMSFLTLYHFPPQKYIYIFCSCSLGSAISMVSCIHSILCACDTLPCLRVFRVWKPPVICKYIFHIEKWGGAGFKHFTAWCAEKI